MINSKLFPLVELAILAFCAWLSRDLLNAWQHSPHDRFGWLARLVWLVPLGLRWRQKYTGREGVVSWRGRHRRRRGRTFGIPFSRPRHPGVFHRGVAVGIALAGRLAGDGAGRCGMPAAVPQEPRQNMNPRAKKFSPLCRRKCRFRSASNFEILAGCRGSPSTRRAASV